MSATHVLISFAGSVWSPFFIPVGILLVPCFANLFCTAGVLRFLLSRPTELCTFVNMYLFGKRETGAWRGNVGYCAMPPLGLVQKCCCGSLTFDIAFELFFASVFKS